MNRLAPRVPLRLVLSLAVALGASSALAGCASLRDDLQHAETAFDAARYDESEVWLRDLERHAPEMDVEQRSRFYYMRGMTAYRLRHRADALHYLALAREVSGPRHMGLRPEWVTAMTRAIDELAPDGAGGEESRVRGSSGGDEGANDGAR
jgi:hypothetical protein